VPYCGFDPLPAPRFGTEPRQPTIDAREPKRASRRLWYEVSFHLSGVPTAATSPGLAQGATRESWVGNWGSTVTNRPGVSEGLKDFEGQGRRERRSPASPCLHIRLDTTTGNRRRRLRISGCPSHPTIVAEGSPISSLIDLQPGRQRHQDIGRWALPRDHTSRYFPTGKGKPVSASITM
jgi:hypothetical protein